MLEPVRPLEALAGLVDPAESVEDLTLRAPGHNQGRVRTEQGVVVAERVDESRVDGLRCGRGGRLPPSSGQGRRIGRGAKDVLDLQTVLFVFRWVQVRGFPQGIRGFGGSAQLLEDLRAVHPGALQRRVGVEEAVVVLELFLEAVRLREGRDGRGHPLPARQEVFHDAFRIRGRRGRLGRGDGRPADRAFRFIGEEVSAAPRTERRALVEARLEPGEECEFFGCVLTTAHPALRRLPAHPGATGETDPGRGIFLDDEVFDLIRQPRVGRGFEFHAAKRTRFRRSPGE